MIELRSFGNAEIESDPAAIEERHLRSLKQKVHAEHIAIERDRPVDIVDDDGDLSYLIEREHGISGSRFD